MSRYIASYIKWKLDIKVCEIMLNNIVFIKDYTLICENSWWLIWYHTRVQHRVMSNDVDWSPFRNQWSRHIFDRFVVVSGKLDTRTGVDLFRLSYWLHRCRWRAFVRTTLLVWTRWAFRFFVQVMHLKL